MKILFDEILILLCTQYVHFHLLSYVVNKVIVLPLKPVEYFIQI